MSDNETSLLLDRFVFGLIRELEGLRSEGELEA